MKLFTFISVGLMVLMISCQDKDNRPVLTIYSHSSFLSSYGPGPELAKIFESQNNVKVEMIDAGDASLMLQRMRLDRESPVDLVIGLDQLSRFEAQKIVKWEPISKKGMSWSKDFPKGDWGSFLPYDWAPLTFVYKKDRVKGISSWEDLLKPELKRKLAIQDPRLSTPGLQLLYAISQVKGDDYKSYLVKFNKSVYRVAPSWSSSYSLFQKGKARAVFSYLTSPLYHKIHEGDDSYHSAIFKEGHPVQVELVGVPKLCKNCELAQKFARLMVSKEAQRIIMNKNIMLPVVSGVVEGTPFEKLPKVKTLSVDNMSEFAKNKRSFVKRWTESIGGGR